MTSGDGKNEGQRRLSYCMASVDSGMQEGQIKAKIALVSILSKGVLRSPTLPEFPPSERAVELGTC